jgi:hypothetical protein
MGTESNILQKRMIDMQQDFNKYKELKEIIDQKQSEINEYKKDNDKLSVELMLIKSNDENFKKDTPKNLNSCNKLNKIEGTKNES